MPSIVFTPEIGLDSEQVPKLVPIKGQVPLLAYPFALKDIWNTISSLDTLQAYQRICEQFDRLDRILAQRLHLRPGRSLPPVRQAKDATVLLAVLFDPRCFVTNDLWSHGLTLEPVHDKLLQVETARPFPLRCASKHKLLHTLAWIDSNIKINVELVANRCSLPAQTIIQIVEAALIIYSLLLKHQDYSLARTINFNHSMFLQDRIINLIFGDELYLAGTSLRSKGMVSNRLALELLKGLPRLSLRQLCLSSIFMGIVWTSDESVQRFFKDKPDKVLGDIDSQIKSAGNRLAVDDIDEFLKELSAPKAARAVVVLDDNGESVFDVALFQRLLEEIDTLNVTFVMNRFPVSNNISEETFGFLLEDDFFAGLKGMMESGRMGISLEQQMFRSFEMEHLTAETLRWIDSSTLVYVKGANFFETFQATERPVYHAFTVYGEMCMTLTGYPQGSGIFVRIPSGRVPFIYQDSTHVVTLKALVETAISQGKGDAR